MHGLRQWIRGIASWKGEGRGPGLAVALVSGAVLSVFSCWALVEVHGSWGDGKGANRRAAFVAASTVPLLPPSQPSMAVDGQRGSVFHSVPGGLDGTLTLTSPAPVAATHLVIFPQKGIPDRLPRQVEVSVSDLEAGGSRVLGVFYPAMGYRDGRVCIALDGGAAVRGREWKFNLVGNPEAGYLTFDEWALVKMRGPVTTWMFRGLAALLGLVLGFLLYQAGHGFHGGWGEKIRRFWATASPVDERPEPAKWLWLLVFVPFILSQWPLLQSAFYGDDYANSMLHGWLDVWQKSLAQYAADDVVKWARDAGRIFPVAIYASHAWNDFFPDRLAFKLTILLWLMVQAGLFAAVARSLASRRSPGLLLVVLLPLFFQYRAFYDPILAFSPLLHILQSLLIFSLLAYLRYRKGANPTWLVLAGFAYGLALLTYEVALPYVAVFPLVVLLESPGERKRGYGDLAIMAGIWIGAVALTFWARHAFGTAYGGTRLSLDFGDVWSTFRNQIMGAVPLDYFRRGSMGPPEMRTFEWVLHFGTVALAMALAFHILHRGSWGLRVAVKYLVIGLLWCAMAGILISLSERYQKEISPGHPYLPVLLEYFGLALATVGLLGGMQCLLAVFAPRVPRWVLPSILALSVGGVLHLSGLSNAKTVSLINTDWRWPREQVEISLKAGAFAGIPQGSVVWVDREETIWQLDAGFFRLYSGKKLEIRYTRDARPASAPALQQNQYLIRYGATAGGWGDMQVLALTSGQWTEKGLEKPVFGAEIRMMRRGRSRADRSDNPRATPPMLDVATYRHRLTWP